MDVPKVVFVVGEDKDSIGKRVARGQNVGLMGPKSALYANAEVKAGVDNLVTDTGKLTAAVTAATTAHALAEQADKVVVTLTDTWDKDYGILLALAPKVCKTTEDGTGLGLVVPGPTVHHAVAPPVAVHLRQDFKKDRLVVNVERAPGMRTVDVEYAFDGVITPATVWKMFDTNGARHVLPHPPKGPVWVRAASRSTRGKSECTTPVSIIIK